MEDEKNVTSVPKLINLNVQSETHDSKLLRNRGAETETQLKTKQTDKQKKSNTEMELIKRSVQEGTKQTDPQLKKLKNMKQKQTKTMRDVINLTQGDEEFKKVERRNKRTRNYRFPKQRVPQGFILGPLFFILFINNLQNATRSPVVLFADDSPVVCSVNDTESLKIILKETSN